MTYIYILYSIHDIYLYIYRNIEICKIFIYMCYNWQTSDLLALAI